MDSKANPYDVNMADSTEELKKESSMQQTISQQHEDCLKTNTFSQKVSNIKSTVRRKRFWNRSNLFRHLTSLPTNAHIFICYICGKTFLFQRSFHQHVSVVHFKLHLKEQNRKLLQNRREEKCSFQDKCNVQDNDKHVFNIVASSSNSQESNADSKFQNCAQTNNMRGRDLKKKKYLLDTSLPRKWRRKYIQRMRPDLYLPYFDLRTCYQYQKYGINWKSCTTISRKNWKLKILKKSKKCGNLRNAMESGKTKLLTESIEPAEKYIEKTDCSEKNMTAERRKNSITDLIVNLNTSTTFDDNHVESNGADEKKRVIKKYLPCTNKLKSHQDHSYGKISPILLSVINDTNGAANNTFSEYHNDVDHVATTKNSHPQVDSIFESYDTLGEEKHKIAIDTAPDSTKRMNSLFNALKENSQKVSLTKGVITHPENTSLRRDSQQKQIVRSVYKSTTASNSNQEYLKKNCKVNRKVKKILAVCFMCKEVYSLMHHLRIKQIATRNNGPAIDCPFCKRNFISLAHLETHITSTHLKCEGKTKAGQKYVVEIIHPDKPVNYQNNEELAFECHCCPRRFDNLEAFNSHVTNSHTRANTEHAKATARTLAKIKEILSSEIVETIFGKDSDTIEDNLKQGTRVKTNLQDERTKGGDFARNLRSNRLTSQQSESNSVCSLELQETKITEHTPDKKDVLDKLICDLGIQSPIKPAKVYPFVCTICSKRFELERDFILHTEMHVGSVIRESRESQEKNNVISKKKQNLFQSSSHSLSERWSPTNLRVYTRKPKIQTNNNNNSVRAGNNKDSRKVIIKGETLFEADSTISSDTSVVLSNHSKSVVKRKTDSCASSVTKKLRGFSADVSLNEIEPNHENEDKLVTSTTQGTSYSLSNKRFEPKKNCDKYTVARSSQHKPVKNNNKCLQNNNKAPIIKKLPEVSNNDAQSMIVETSVAVPQEKGVLVKKTKLWHCRPCKRNFNLIADFIRHKYYYHNDDSVVHICENCTKILTSVAMVNTHTCTNVKHWSCKRCNLKFPNGIFHRQHNTDHHYENVGPHVCSTCKKNFLTMSMLERHVLTTHAFHKSESSLLSISKTSRKLNDSAISSTETLTDQETSGNFACQNEDPISDEVPGLERTLWLHHLKKTSLQDCEVVTITRLTVSGKDQFKCNLCESVHLTKLGIKLHLIKQHKTSVDICSLCSKLYIAESIAQHLMNEHMTPEESSSEYANLRRTQQANHTDFVRVLGPKQLYSLCEYRKLGSPMRNKCFKCTMCYREFLNFRFCRTHYFKIHDIVCVLCNKEFVDSRQATDHKLRIHGPVSSYLWAVQKIFAVVLESKKYGKTVQEVIYQLTTKTSKRSSATMSKTRRNLVDNGQYREKHRLRKADNLRDENRQKRTLQAAEVIKSKSFRKSHDNSTNVISEESTILAARTSNVQIEDQSEIQCTISAENESCGNAFVLMVTEDDLKLYRNNIKELVSRLCLPSKVFSEDYVTELLLNYVQQIGP